MKPTQKTAGLIIGHLILAFVVFWALAAPTLAGKGQKQTDEKLIRQCIELAKSAVAKGNQPFGALMVKDGEVIMTAENTVKTDNNTLAHAETNLIAATFRKYGPKGTKGSTLYTSCEPCPMCCGAIYMAGISRVVYGMSGKKLAELSGFDAVIYSRKMFSLSGRKISVTGPVLGKEAAAVMAAFLKTWKRPK